MAAPRRCREATRRSEQPEPMLERRAWVRIRICGLGERRCGNRAKRETATTSRKTRDRGRGSVSCRRSGIRGPSTPTEHHRPRPESRAVAAFQDEFPISPGRRENKVDGGEAVGPVSPERRRGDRKEMPPVRRFGPNGTLWLSDERHRETSTGTPARHRPLTLRQVPQISAWDLGHRAWDMSDPPISRPLGRLIPVRRPPATG